MLVPVYVMFCNSRLLYLGQVFIVLKVTLLVVREGGVNKNYLFAIPHHSPSSGSLKAFPSQLHAVWGPWLPPRRISEVSATQQGDFQKVLWGERSTFLTASSVGGGGLSPVTVVLGRDHTGTLSLHLQKLFCSVQKSSHSSAKAKRKWAEGKDSLRRSKLLFELTGGHQKNPNISLKSEKSCRKEGILGRSTADL